MKRPNDKTAECDIDDRLPSEYLIAEYALRGYRGAPTLVSERKFLNAVPRDVFCGRHVVNMKEQKFSAVSESFVEQDCQTIEALSQSNDAVRIVPAH